MNEPAVDTARTEPNHPAQILHDRDAALIRADGKDLGSVRYAANILWAHETNNHLTFVALDNDALAYVRAEWVKGVNGDPQADLYGAVGSLLGLNA